MLSGDETILRAQFDGNTLSDQSWKRTLSHSGRTEFPQMLDMDGVYEGELHWALTYLHTV